MHKTAFEEFVSRIKEEPLEKILEKYECLDAKAQMNAMARAYNTIIEINIPPAPPPIKVYELLKEWREQSEKEIQQERSAK